MPRHARIQSPTGYYHIMMRGNNRESIFSRDDQKRLFYECLKEYGEDHSVDIVAYCLMDNHVHIVVKANTLNLANAIKCINTKYAMNFNRQRDRVGHVFQDRYKSQAILDDKYLLQVIRYVHNNPVKAKMVKSFKDYSWSSYNEYIDENFIVGDQQKEFVLGYFSRSIEQFEEFHKKKDNLEYLEVKEDIVKERMEAAQDIISEFFTKKGLIEAKQVKQNFLYLEELIQNLLEKSKLTHRQIASLLSISNNVVHSVSLQKIDKE